MRRARPFPRLPAVLLVMAMLMTCCSTQDLESTLTCDVSQEDNLTRYSVPEFQASSCHYSWILNNSGPVLAHHGPETDERVFLKNNTTLITNQCFSTISYTRTCITERIARTAYCTTNCSRPPPDHLKRKGTPRHHWILLTSILCFVGVAGIFAVVWRICENRKGRTQVPQSLHDEV